MELRASRHIARSSDEVFTFVSDAANNPRWQRGMRSCAWTSPPPVAVGSTYRQEARFLGRTVRSEFVVTEHEPGRSITIRSTGGSFPITVQRSVAPAGTGRSRVTAEITGEPGRFFRLAAPLVRRLAQRSVDADYDRLQRLLERPAPTPP